MPSLDLDEVRLHYEVDGSGPPLLLIAGSCSDSASWGPIVAPLSERFTVIRPDNRTCGRTTPWNAPASVRIWANDFVALLDHLDVGPAHVAGHSLGGLIALQLAAAFPTHAASLMLLAYTPRKWQRNVTLFDTLAELRKPDLPPDLWLRAFFPWLFHPRLFEDPQAVEAAVANSLAYPYAQSAQAMKWQADRAREFDLGPMVRSVKQPVHAIYGRDDLLMPVGPACEAIKAINHATFEVIDECGHSIHWDQPQAVTASMLSFLGAQEQRQ